MTSDEMSNMSVYLSKSICSEGKGRRGREEKVTTHAASSGDGGG